MSYKYKQFKNNSVTKNGHTMFIGDVVSDLNRKSFVEDLLIEQNKEIADLKTQLKTKERDYQVMYKLNRGLEAQLANHKERAQAAYELLSEACLPLMLTNSELALRLDGERHEQKLLTLDQPTNQEEYSLTKSFGFNTNTDFLKGDDNET